MNNFKNSIVSKFKNQSGFSQIIIFLIMLIGIGVGVWLTQHPTFFRPKASGFGTRVDICNSTDSTCSNPISETTSPNLQLKLIYQLPTTSPSSYNINIHSLITTVYAQTDNSSPPTTSADNPIVSFFKTITGSVTNLIQNLTGSVSNSSPTPSTDTISVPVPTTQTPIIPNVQTPRTSSLTSDTSTCTPPTFCWSADGKNTDLWKYTSPDCTNAKSSAVLQAAHSSQCTSGSSILSK